MDNKISVGKRLKEAREKKSLTIEQVQKQTKIHSSVLKALEEGYASTLLTDTYVRSFLKNYSQVLGLPAAEILKEYFPPRPELSPSAAALDKKQLSNEAETSPKMLYFTGIAILGIAVVLGVALIGAKLVSSFGKAGSTQREKRAATVPVSKKKQPKSVKSAQNKKSAAKTAQAQESKDIIPGTAKLNLTIRVKESVLVTLKRDGVLMYSVIMNKGTVENITADESIELRVLKTDALDLILNGQQIVLPPKKNINGIIITRKGVRLK